MTAARNCPQCAKPMSSDAPQGLCPECLFQAALPGQSAADTAATDAIGASSTEAISPEAGMRLRYFGDYELLEEIARGGMGIVWKARQSSLNRDVALKMIRAGVLASRGEVERFLREAEAAANLQHPNIVAIHEVGEHGGQHYYTMDYVAGRNLDDLVKEGPLSPRSAARYAKIVADAIQFAHQRGVLHRDLKPQNVLIDADDQPRITDFGFAKIMKDESRLTQSGVVMGSPSYMPPEQAGGRHEDIGPASDVYSIGAMLYELLSGRAPFRGATALATMREVMESEPVPPSRIQQDIPSDLETICLKCLEKRPLARYPTARALAEELDRYLRGEPIQARPASAVRKTVSWARRHPGFLAAAAALVMVALGFGVFYLFEENAFLRAQHADPQLIRTRGPLHESLEMWNVLNLFAGLAGIYLLLAVIIRSRGLTIKELFDPARQARPIRPLGERARTVVLCAGLALVGCGVLNLAKSIQAHVWEGESLVGQVFQFYGTTYFGLAALGLVIRDYQLAHYGHASRQLTEEQIEPIRRAMEDFDWKMAVKIYREAVPDASLAEATQFALQLAESLRAQNPGKFIPRPLSLATLHWNAMAICVVIEAMVLGILWITVAPANPSRFVAVAAAAFLFGVGSMAGAGVKGFWKRMALMIPGLVGLGLTFELWPWLEDVSSLFVSPFMIGMLCGVSLMISGFTRQRRRTTSGA